MQRTATTLDGLPTLVLIHFFFPSAQGKHCIYTPHTAGRYARKRFRKAQCPIVERMVVAMMSNGRNNGKKAMAMRIVRSTLQIINVLTDQNPLQVRELQNYRKSLWLLCVLP